MIHNNNNVSTYNNNYDKMLMENGIKSKLTKSCFE